MTDKSFGSYYLPPWGRFVVSICQCIPTNWLGKRIVFLLRKPVMLLKQSPIDSEVKGARFRLYPGSNLSDKRLLCTPDLLDGAERRFFVEALKPGSWLIDLGANIGGYSLLMFAARHDLKIVAVEADPELAARLTKNIAFSGFERQIEVLKAAATEVPGTVVLERDAINRGKNAVVEMATPCCSTNEMIEVEGMTLLDIMERSQIGRPGAVKLDIEGHELSVLRGFFDKAPTDRWPSFIQLEQHRKHKLNPAVNLVLQRGYRLLKRTRMNVILGLD